MAVLARGHIDVYEARGEYQLLVEAIEPQGHGALQFAFEQLKKKLAAEGLFDPARKRPIPRLPQRIGIVTSPIRAPWSATSPRSFPADFRGCICVSIRHWCRATDRWKRCAAPSNTSAIQDGPQVVIVARGGGSLEDLWTFNEESVARAIAASTVPVISAVGHETDFTIADFVADLRAATPSAAAELAICPREQIFDQLTVFDHKLVQATRYRLAMAARALHERGVERASAILHRNIGRWQQRVDELDYRMRGRAQTAASVRRKRLEELTARLRRLDLRLRIARARQRLEAADTAAAQMIHLRLTRAHGRLNPCSLISPSSARSRSWNAAMPLSPTRTGAIVKQPADAPADSKVDVRLAQGKIAARVLPGE